MHPNLFSIGPITFHAYGLMAAIGIMSASWYLAKHAGDIGGTKDQMIDLLLISVVSGFAAARALYVAYEWEYFKQNPLEILAIWNGGIIFYGGLLGGLAGLFIYTKRLGWPVLKTLDLFTPATALAQGFGRIGCFLNGCCYGKETGCFLGVRFPSHPLPLHPTQLYDSALCFLLFVILVKFYSKNRSRAGSTSLLYFTLQPIGRFTIEFFRNDMAKLLFGLTFGQWMSIGIFAVAIIFALILKQRPGVAQV